MKKFFTTFIIVTAIALASSAAYVYYSTKKAVDSFIDGVRPFVTVKYQTFSNPMDGSISIRGVSLSPNLGTTDSSIDIGSIELKMDSVLDYFNFEEKIKSGVILPKLQLKINHVFADLDLLTNDEPDDFERIAAYITALGCGDIKEISNKNLADLGYAGIDGSINVDFEYSKLTSQVDMKFEIVMHDMGRYSARASIPNIYSAVDLADINNKLNSLEFQIQDLGYNETLIEYCAKQTGLKTDTYISRHMQAVKSYLTNANVSLSKEMYDAYRSYFVDQASLTITSHPASATNMEDIALFEAKDWSNILGLTLFVNDDAPRNILFDWNKETVIDDLLNARSIAVKTETTNKPATAPQTRHKQKFKAPRVYTEIPVTDLDEYINYQVKLETKLGRIYEGYVKGVTRSQVIVVIRLKGGKAEIPVGTNKISKVFISKP